MIISVLIFVFRKKTYEKITAVSGFILVITMIAALSLFLTHITSKKERLWYSGVDQFKVASDENVIVLVPDTLGRTALNAMLQQYPDAVDFLNDFTFYENEDSMYFPTYPALHHMLTDYPYDETMSRFEYTKDAFESEKARLFFDHLHDKDFSVRLYTNDILFEHVTQGIADNIEEAHITTDRASLLKFLYKMSMYRYVPYSLKAAFPVDTLELSNISQYNGIGPHHLNSEFYSEMQNQGITIDDKIQNAFILHHIRGTHMPYISNANNELVEANSVSGEETSYGTMRLIEEYLERLKDIGKYDDATIIIVADHGFYDTDSIFYIKEKGESHDQTVVNSEMITHADFQDIVLKSIDNIED